MFGVYAHSLDAAGTSAEPHGIPDSMVFSIMVSSGSMVWDSEGRLLPLPVLSPTRKSRVFGW